MNQWEKYHYKTKAVVSEIKGESSATIVLTINGKDNYFKILYGETRIVPHTANIEKERQILFDDINAVVDSRVLEIANTYSPTGKK